VTVVSWAGADPSPLNRAQITWAWPETNLAATKSMSLPSCRTVQWMTESRLNWPISEGKIGAISPTKAPVGSVRLMGLFLAYAAFSGGFEVCRHTMGARAALGRGDARQATAGAFQAAFAGFKTLAECGTRQDREARRWRSEGGRVRAAQVEAERRPQWDRWLSMAADLERRLAGQGKPGTRAMARWIAMELRRERGEIIPVATIRDVLRRKGQ